jgi:cobalt/nickel transport system permease protein
MLSGLVPSPSTFWHWLAPQTRILCVFLLVLAIVCTPNGHWQTWGFYGLAIASLILYAQVPLKLLLQRLVVESAFVSVVLLGTLFREGGQVLWQWGWLRVTTVGLTVLGSVTCKALLALLVLNLLTLTTPVSLLFQGLVALRTPPLLVAILASMYRYKQVLQDEFTCMSRAAAARNLIGNPHRHRLVVGNMIGSLFIRTYDRGDRIYRAMLARGYQGLPTLSQSTPLTAKDGWALTVTVTLALLGQAIYLLPQISS